MTESRAPVQPPEIRHLKARGVTGARLRCLKCSRGNNLTWDEIGLSDTTPFPEIAIHKGFLCAECGSREFCIMPDWPEYKAEGGG